MPSRRSRIALVQSPSAHWRVASSFSTASFRFIWLFRCTTKNYNMHFHRPTTILQVVVALLCWGLISAEEDMMTKPDFIKSCKIYQPGFTKCSTESVQKLFEQLAIGIPRIVDIIGPMEPFDVGPIIYKQDNNDAANIRANLTDLTLTGLSKLKIKQSRVSKKDFSWETKVMLPKMRLEGNYKMKGQILIIPLNGAGHMFIEIDNMDMVVRTKTQLFDKGGYTYYNVTQVRVDFNMTGLRTNFDNIFNGNSKDVEDSTNQFFNDNWQDFFEALRPVVYETVESVLLKILHTTFEIIPANFFVEDIPTAKELYARKAA